MNTRGMLFGAAMAQADALAVYLAERREGLGLTHVVVAQRIGIHPAIVKGWEARTFSPGLVDLVAWMMALGTNAVVSPAALERAEKVTAGPSTWLTAEWFTSIQTEIGAAIDTAAKAADGAWVEEIGDELAAYAQAQTKEGASTKSLSRTEFHRDQRVRRQLQLRKAILADAERSERRQDV